MTISWIAAIIGLIIAIGLILLKLNPVYSLFLGAILGCLLGGASLTRTITILTTGTQSIMGTAIRVLAAGMLAGVMMESGAADSIAHAIVNKLGNAQAILSLALSTMIITAVGVFIPVAVLIVAPIALSVGKEAKISKLSLLVALSGGGKAGNVISPNPNTIAAASGFHTDLSKVMIAGFIPALCGLAMTVLIASIIKKRGALVKDSDIQSKTISDNLIPLHKALITPILAIALLLISPVGEILHVSFLTNFKVDAMYVLPIASIIGALLMGQGKHILKYSKEGLDKVTNTVMILIGAGAIAGLITASNLSKAVVSGISTIGISGTFLAPISGILMGAAIGSTSTAVILATGSFGPSILNTGISSVGAAVMVQTGATVIDQVPQGNYFHITAQSMNMSIKDRLKAVPFEACVGLTMTIVATIMYGIL
ncbi:SLC13 family permease [Fructilactobacillus vespulae]|uniref:GntP family permease n=1 Tax=Fructilactobacillus vespulae TaxID=1249630 RepID=UPI0039B419BB